MDFTKFKEKDSSQEKATFAARVDEVIYKKFMEIKSLHKESGCSPYRIHDIVEVMLQELTEQMEKDIAAKTQTKAE